MLIDTADAGETAGIEALGVRVLAGAIVMRGPEEKRHVARMALKFLEAL
jgi:hypothetical protein